MKYLRLWILNLGIALSIFNLSCGKSDTSTADVDKPDTEIVAPPTNYILGAKVLDKENAEILIDQESRLLTVKLLKNAGRLAVKIKFELANGVSMYYPKVLDPTFDFALKKAEVWLDFMGQQVKYTLQLEEVESIAVDPLMLNWVDVSDQFGSLPTAIKVYRSPELLQGRKAKAFIAVADIRNGSKFEVMNAIPAQTPDVYYTQSNHPIIMNSGYMYNATNICMLVKNGQRIATNVQTVNRANAKGEAVMFYTTRGNFGLMKDGAFRSEWAFSIDNKNYGYSSPLLNKEGGDPLPGPTASASEGAFELDMQDVVGAGPVLIRKGKIENTWAYEFWDDTGGITPNAPVQRSAIGITENQKLIFFVCEGRNVSPGVPGFTTGEVAFILKDLGCVEALNLDGGGSTCMLVNGKNTVIPNGGQPNQRIISTAVGISIR